MGYNEEMPANSVWRYECKRVAKQESRPKPQPNESVTTPGLSLAEVARQLGVTTSAILEVARRAGGKEVDAGNNIPPDSGEGREATSGQPLLFLLAKAATNASPSQGQNFLPSSSFFWVRLP